MHFFLYTKTACYRDSLIVHVLKRNRNNDADTIQNMTYLKELSIERLYGGEIPIHSTDFIVAMREVMNILRGRATLTAPSPVP